MKGSIRQRSPGSWEISVFLGRDPNGRRTRKTETVRGKKSDAERRLREILGDVDRGITPATTNYTVAEWLDQWLDEKEVDGRREKTTDRYRDHIRIHIKPALGRVKLGKLSPMQVKAFELDLIKNGKDPIGVVAVHAVLKAALDQAVQMEVIGRNPAASVKPPRAPRKEAFVPEASQVRALLAEAEQSGHHLRPAAHVAAYTGLRRGEIAGLEWRNVDLNSGTLKVVQSLVVTAKRVKMEEPKSKSSKREIEIDEGTVEILANHRARQIDLANALNLDSPPMVFPKLCLTDWCRPSDLGKWVTRMAEKAGCPKLTLHSLRHFHASMLLQSGLNPAVVAERLGHSSAAITLSIYAHCLPGWQRGAAEAFSDLMREAA